MRREHGTDDECDDGKSEYAALASKIYRGKNLESKVSLFNFALFRFKMGTSDKIAKVLLLSQHQHRRGVSSTLSIQKREREKGERKQG